MKVKLSKNIYYTREQLLEKGIDPHDYKTLSIAIRDDITYLFKKINNLYQYVERSMVSGVQE